MAEAIKRSVLIIFLIAIAILLGYVIDNVLQEKEKADYPMMYSEYVEKYSEMYDVPKDIVYAIIKTESGFNPNAESSKGACGLMQLMPNTYEWICGKAGIPYKSENIKDPQTNIQCGVYYLSFCYDEFIVWETVYAAYNAGHGQVREWLKDDKIAKNGRLIDIPYPETESYVKKISQAREIYLKLLEVQESE